jgi:hypothetical protein
MLLLTQDLRARLIANAVPITKQCSAVCANLCPHPSSNSSIPLGAATWLFSELDEDGDTLFGLCDLGFGCPEMGSASLTEIAAVSLPLRPHHRARPVF